MSFDNFIVLALSLLSGGVVLGIFFRKLWKQLTQSRLYYLLTPKLIQPYTREKESS